MNATALTGFAFVAVSSSGPQRVLFSTGNDSELASRAAVNHSRRIGPDPRPSFPVVAADCCWTVVESTQPPTGGSTASWCAPDAPPPFDMTGEQHAKSTTVVRQRWCCVQEVKWADPPPTGTVGNAVAAAAAPSPSVRIFGAAVLTGARLKTISGYLTFSCIAFARDLVARCVPHSAAVESVPRPPEAALIALEMLVTRPILADGSGPALSLDCKRNTTFASGGFGASHVANAPAAISTCFPHSDVPLECFLFAFAYEQAQLLLSLMAQDGADAICFVSRHLSTASSCVAAALGLMYPLRWHGAIKPSIQRREALLCVQSLQDGDSVILGTTADAVPDLLLWVQSQPRDQRRRIWIADCASGLVSLAAPITDPTKVVELLPHDFDLKDTWKRHRVGVRPDLSLQAQSQQPQPVAPASPSLNAAPMIPDETATHPGEIPQLSQDMVGAILTAVCDALVAVLGGYRTGLQKSMAGVSVTAQRFLPKALGATPGQPNTPGMPLTLAMLNAACVQTWATEMAAFEELWGIARMREGAALRWWVWRFVERCADKNPEAFTDVASDKQKKASSGAFSVFSSFMKSAKQTVRNTVSGMPLTAPTHVEFLRVTSGMTVAGKRCSGNELALALATAPMSSQAIAEGVVKSAPRASHLACNLVGHAPLGAALPHMEMTIARHYTVNGHCPLSSALGGEDDIPPAIRVSRGVPVLPLDMLGNFEDYHRLSQPPVMAQRKPAAAVAAAPLTTAPPATLASPTRAPPAVVPAPAAAPLAPAQAYPAPPPPLSASAAALTDHQARLRSVLDLSHLTGGSSGAGGGGTASGTSTPPPFTGVATPNPYSSHHTTPPAEPPKGKSLDDFF